MSDVEPSDPMQALGALSSPNPNPSPSRSPNPNTGPNPNPNRSPTPSPSPTLTPSPTPHQALEAMWSSRIKRSLEATAEEVKRSVLDKLDRDREGYQG